MIAVDLGYGYTKAVSESQRVIFPSALAPTQDNDDIGMGTIGHYMEFKRPGELKKRTLAFGDRAVKEGQAVQFSLDSQKFSKEASAVLAAAAAYMTGAEGQTKLAVGLPISRYKNRDYIAEVENALKKVAVYLSVDNGPQKYISFLDVKCYPQGIGVLYSLDTLPPDGLVGLLDIGFLTTDLVLFNVNGSRIEPLKEYFRSINMGVSLAIRMFMKAYEGRTGDSLTLADGLELWKRKEITYCGKRLDITQMVRDGKENTGRAICDAVNEAWAEKVKMLDYVLLAGGGALELGEFIKEILPQATVVNDPQFANVLGFYRMAELSSKGKKEAATA